MPEPKARSRHTVLTTEAFREIAEEALAELVENSDTLELDTLTAWTRALKLAIGRVSDRTTGDGSPMAMGRVDRDALDEMCSFGAGGEE
jgi:hypothetical protein